MTKIKRFEEIRERAEKATEGPWALFDANDTTAVMTRKVLKANWPEKINPRIKCREIVAWSGFDQSDYPKRQVKNNAKFIAHAREDIPWMADIIDALLPAAQEWLKSVDHARHAFIDGDEQLVKSAVRELEEK